MPAPLNSRTDALYAKCQEVSVVIGRTLWEQIPPVDLLAYENLSEEEKKTVLSRTGYAFMLAVRDIRGPKP